MIAKILIEDCTELHMFVGTAANSATRIQGWHLIWESARTWSNS